MGVIVITGGSRGIGASTAQHLARRGMGVILTYKNSRDAARRVVADIEQFAGKAVALGWMSLMSVALSAFAKPWSRRCKNTGERAGLPDL
ncbi:hypothetical protein GLGCALEP_03722 [Pseudomonas sp. MM221]|nr:hypothetical protein GLGCALEP_03722 [Pseudomonas sp. MM221]